MQCYSACRNGFLTRATAQVSRYCNGPLPGGTRVVQSIKTECRKVTARGWRWEDGNGELLFNGCRGSGWDDVKVLETDSGDAYTKI